MSSHLCALCEGPGTSVSFCTACNFNLCNDCWVTHPPHRKGLLGPQVLPHEHADPSIVDDLKVCLEEPTEDIEYRMHQEDEETTWFGFEQDIDGETVLADLVSFIDQTGAGKSSLINLLIGLNAGSSTGTSDDFGRSTPVIGRSSSVTPTFADVHLYLSPDTIGSKQTILYADCESFNGGERNPVAINAITSDHITPPECHIQTRHKPNIASKMSQGTKRLLKWASHNSLSYEEAKKRSYTVSEMYPRIFYAFSDVVVFVLDHPTILEVVVERLLEWADANYSKSINQPIKPHAIIALNKSNTSTPENQEDTVDATAHLLNTTNAKIVENQTFVKYTKVWKKASLAQIHSMHDLLRCYYSTVHVVRLPEKSRYQLLSQQRKQLHRVIQDCCTLSYKDKQERELLTDVVGLYLSLAFDHFFETLDEPFDFVEASLKKNPLSDSFANNLLNFARSFAAYRKPSGQIIELFQTLTLFVASCILLESARKQRIGRPEDWFGTLDDEFRGHKRRLSSIPSEPKAGTY